MDLNNTTTPEEERDLAQTPWWFIGAVQYYFGVKFELDVCCLEKTAKAPAFYSLQDYNVDGLSVPWARTNWCNPPYSDVLPWVKKAANEAKNGAISFLLIPDKPEVSYIRACREYADTITHMPFRLNFLRPDGTEFLDKDGNKQGPKFPVALALFAPWGLGVPVRDIYVDFRKYRGK